MASIPAVKALEERHHARGLRVIGVTKMGDDEEEQTLVATTAKKHAMSAPTFLDPDGAWSKEANVAQAPGFLLIDREGRVAYRHIGKLDESYKAFNEMNAILEKM